MKFLPECKNYYSWRRCDRGCPCNSGVDEYCDRGEGSGERGVCMRVIGKYLLIKSTFLMWINIVSIYIWRALWYTFWFIDCEFVDFTLHGYIGSEEEAIKSGFDYNDKEGAIAKCRQSKHSFIYIATSWLYESIYFIVNTFTEMFLKVLSDFYYS